MKAKKIWYSLASEIRWATQLSPYAPMSFLQTLVCEQMQGNVSTLQMLFDPDQCSSSTL